MSERVDAFHEEVERRMRELSRDMEWNLLHVESTVSDTQEEWNAKAGWKKWMWRRWWAWRSFTWRCRRRLAQLIYPFSEEE